MYLADSATALEMANLLTAVDAGENGLASPQKTSIATSPQFC